MFIRWAERKSKRVCELIYRLTSDTTLSFPLSDHLNDKWHWLRGMWTRRLRPKVCAPARTLSVANQSYVHSAIVVHTKGPDSFTEVGKGVMKLIYPIDLEQQGWEDENSTQTLPAFADWVGGRTLRSEIKCFSTLSMIKWSLSCSVIIHVCDFIDLVVCWLDVWLTFFTSVFSEDHKWMHFW